MFENRSVAEGGGEPHTHCNWFQNESYPTWRLSSSRPRGRPYRVPPPAPFSTLPPPIRLIQLALAAWPANLFSLPCSRSGRVSKTRVTWSAPQILHTLVTGPLESPRTQSALVGEHSIPGNVPLTPFGFPDSLIAILNDPV